MALFNFTDQLHTLTFESFARPVTVTPTVSQPGQPAYSSRGYFGTKELDIITEAGGVLSDSQSYLDIIMAEFPVLPRQGDTIDIPDHQSVPGGSFMVLDLAGVGEGSGLITVQLRKVVTNKPASPP
jgi:hypothetical protein